VRVDMSPRGELERLDKDQRDRMWRAAFAIADDREVASDAVAEAFTQALRGGDAIHSTEHWLWRTVLRIAAGSVRVSPGASGDWWRCQPWDRAAMRSCTGTGGR